MDIPRILLAAGASGSGKTLITCGLLQALVNRKMKVASFKCGPDYMIPCFIPESSGRNPEIWIPFLQMPRQPDTCLEKMQQTAILQ